MSSDTKVPTNRFLPGSFLVATPYIEETPYRRLVVLLVRHDAQGAMGFIMNDQLSRHLSRLDEFFQSAIRRSSDLKSRRPTGGNRLGSSLDGASEAEAVAPPPLHLFTGVIVWQPGKLEREVQLGVWMVTPARLEVAMHCAHLWSDLVRKIGRDVLQDGLGIRHFPPDTSLN